MQVVWAWLGALAVGLSLGLLGSGGAILTVPILVYLVGHGEKSAIAESLAIVGAIALVGAARSAMQRRVDFRSAALLAFPGILGTSLGAIVARWIPGAVQLALLAGLMLTAATLMFRNGSGPRSGSGSGANPGTRPTNVPGNTPPPSRTLGLIAAQGVGLGMVTGLVGVGGGFLIVPVLVLLRRLPMPTAVGTSLAIIAVNSVTGFLTYLAGHTQQGVGAAAAAGIDWSVIGVFSGVGIAGSLLGNLLGGHLRQETLRRTFAVFLVVMAGYILVRQAPHVLPGLFGPTIEAPVPTPVQLEP